jgi:hypothetical protein
MRTIFVFLFTLSCISAQVNIIGNYSSSFYSFESSVDNEKTLNQYHGVIFKINPKNNSDIYFNGNIKAIYDRNPQEWREKVYNAYFSWLSPIAQTNIQIGRQFIYAGVVNGTLDAVAVSTKPIDKLKLKFYAGVVAPYERDLNLTSWDDGNALGGFASYKVNSGINVNASYFQKQRNEELYWQQLGTAFSGYYNDVFYLIRYDHNLLSSEYQSLLVNASYNYNNWTFSTELSSQKPKVYEDSFFNIFKLREYKQLSVAASHRIMGYDISLRSISTLYEEDESNQHLFLTLGNSWGVVGIVYQTGFGGENLGLYADINYQVLSNLKFNLSSSHYKYERQSVQLEEEATSFSAGVKYNPIKPLSLDVQIQQSINSYYDSDLRGLLKLAYSFKY